MVRSIPSEIIQETLVLVRLSSLHVYNLLFNVLQYYVDNDKN